VPLESSYGEREGAWDAATNEVLYRTDGAAIRRSTSLWLGAVPRFDAATCRSRAG
jgi:hypothetical protein